MSEGLKLLFAFFTLAVIAVIVIKLVNNPNGAKALSDATLGQFNTILKTISGA